MAPFPELILALDPQSLDRTFREIPADISDEEVREQQRTFSTVLTSQDGQRMWLSRLDRDDPASPAATK
jgi:hypothetical protein